MIRESYQYLTIKVERAFSVGADLYVDFKQLNFVEAADGKLATWQSRSGRRPNLILHFVDPGRQPVGRSLSRGRSASVSCDRVLVVLRWDERTDRFYVLTSYPEAGR